jgi:hypothetical protein
MFTLLTTLTVKAQIDLSGRWTAKCVLEKSEHGIIACGICPFSYSEDSSAININDFEIIFGEGLVTIIADGKTSKWDFQMIKDDDIIEIYFEAKKEVFKILLLSSDNYILKDEDGMLIYLGKKE